MNRRRHCATNLLDIFLSVANGTQDGLESYLASNGSPDLSDSSNVTLLHQAVKENHAGKVDLLLQKKCNINTADNDGCTALHLAVEGGHHGILATLLDAGANVNTVAFQHTTPLILAVSKQDHTAVEMILKQGKNCDVNMENFCFQTALTQAVMSQSVDICEILLKHGANVNCLYKGSMKTAMARIMCCNKDMMQLFFSYSKSLNLSYYLMMACILQKFDTAESILLQFEDPFQLEGFGLITLQEEFSVWERLAKSIVKHYKLATKCSTDNKLLMMMLNFCKSKSNQTQRSNHKHRAASLI